MSMLLNEREYGKHMSIWLKGNSDIGPMNFAVKYEVWSPRPDDALGIDKFYYYGQATSAQVRDKFAEEYPARSVYLVIPMDNLANLNEIFSGNQ